MKLFKLPAKLDKRIWLMIALVVSLLLTTSVWIFRPSVSTEVEAKKFYSQHLASLKDDINSLPDLMKSEEKVDDNLDKYHGVLSELIGTCSSLIGAKTDEILKKPLSQQIKDDISNTKKLCEDLMAVAKYSQGLYAALQPYLFMETESWPQPNTAEFTERLNETADVVQYARSRLIKLDNSRVQDPALPELASQIDLTTKLIERIESVSKDNYEASKLTEELLKQIHQDKKDFLDARLYFWNNTIKIEALKRSVTQLEDKFK